MRTLYAFCRTVDDLADQQEQGALGELRWWRQELSQIAAKKSMNSRSIDLANLIHLYSIPIEYFEELISGVEMDLQKNRYATFDELYEYCYRVASVVGLISLKIFGARRKESHLYAINLGVALQLTNILRDIAEDLERGRIYLPQEDLQRFGYTERDLHHRTYNQAFIRLMQFQVERAKQFYRRAEGFSYTSDWPKLAAAQIMGATYYALLEQIEKQDYAVFEKPVSLSSGQKMRIAWGTFLKNRVAAVSGVGHG